MLINYYLKKHPEKKEEFLKRKDIILSIGMFSLCAGILLNRFLTGIIFLDILAGMFIGISIVANLFYLVLWRFSKENKKEN